MSKEDTAIRSKRRKKETTLREVVVKRVRLSFKLHGLEEAMKEYEDIKVMFSDFAPDWSDIADEVLDFFKEKRRLAQEAAVEREQQMTQAMMDGLAKGVVANQLNQLLGSNSQAPYYSSKPNDKRRTQ